MGDNPAIIEPPRRASIFFGACSIAMAAVVFAGFSRTFFLKSWFPEAQILAAPEPIFYLHGTVFTAWIVLVIVQVFLVRSGNTLTHRKLGVAGGVLAVAVFSLGMTGALVAAGRPGGFIGVPDPPLTFLAVPVFDMLLFALFVGMAIVRRGNAQNHKRLMFLATVNLLQAAFIRMIPARVVEITGPMLSSWLPDLFIVALAIWDIRTQRRVHPVTLWAGALIIISQPLRLMIGETSAWLWFASWAVALVK